MFICKLGGGRTPRTPRTPGKPRKPKRKKLRDSLPPPELTATYKVRRNGRIVVLGLKPPPPQPNLTAAQNEDRYREAIAQHTAKLQAQKQAIKDDFIGPRISKKQRRKLAALASQPFQRVVKPVLSYQERDKILRRLFNWDYPTYLKSKLWRDIRQAVMHRDSNRCRKCQKKASEIHHTDYNHEVLRGRQNNKLVAICRTCHINAEFDPDTGRKRSLAEANQVLNLV